MDDYRLTKKQIEAAKAVEIAMNKAKKMGVCFWDNYGNLTAYNGNKIQQPIPDKNYSEKLDDDKVYVLSIDNFGAGNADDQLYVKRK